MIDDLTAFGWSEQQSDCRRLFKENTQPMWVEEGQGIVEVNRAAVDHYGYSRDEFSVTVESATGRGPTICVTVPLAETTPVAQ